MAPTEHSDTSAEPWVAAPDAAPMLDEWKMQDVDLMGEVTHPIRGAILHRFRNPRTVAEIAALMDVPVTRLYHHVNKLADAGLIQVVATRQVAAVTERRYQIVANNFTIADELIKAAEPRELAAAIGSMFDLAKLGLQRSIEESGFLDSLDHGTLSLAEKHLSPAARDELIEQLTALVKDTESDLDEDDPDAIPVTLFVAAYRSTR